MIENSAAVKNIPKTVALQNKVPAIHKTSFVQKKLEQLAESLFFFSALLAVVIVLTMLGFIFYKGLTPFLGSDAYSLPHFLFGTKWMPGQGIYGVFHMAAASAASTAGAVLIGFPIGLCTAIFIAELAPSALARIISPAVNLLAGIPSVLYGAFGIGAVVPAILKITPNVQGQSLLAAMIVLAIMILPTIISLSTSALLSVPAKYREGAYSLGATKMQVIFQIILPAAKPGILSAAILAVGRAIGETMAVILVAGNPESGMFRSVFDKVRPLTSNIAIEIGYASGRQSEMLFATGILLFLFIMAVNILFIRAASAKEK